MSNNDQAVQGGFSNRGWANITEIMPRVTAASAARSNNTVENIDLSTSDNWLLRPEIMKICQESFEKGLSEKHFSYANGISGEPDCLVAFANFFNTYFKPFLPVQQSHCVTATGAASCIDALLYNICDPGDGILIPAPYWSGIDFTFKNRSLVIPIPITTSSIASSMTDELLSALETAIDEASVPIKGLMICNPQNPLGQPYPKSVLEGCIRFCNKHRIHLISDEIYAMTSFDTEDLIDKVPFTSMLAIDVIGMGCELSFVHTIWSTSKDFGQNGVRMGCTVTQANKEIAVGHSLAAMYLTSSLAAVFVTALLGSPDLPRLLKLNSQRVAVAYKVITSFLTKNEIIYVPCYAGLYVFAKIASGAKTWEDEENVVEAFKREGVLVAAGKGYHCMEMGWARIGFTLKPEKLAKGIEQMQRALDCMKNERKVI